MSRQGKIPLQKSMIKFLSIADVISLTNAIFGFFAILFLISDLICVELRLRVSFSFILLALLADGLDGIVARKTGKSDIGEYLESMADMTSLVIAPAVFIYAIYHDVVSGCIYYRSCLVVALIVFLSSSIIRLASFHIMKQSKFFVGLPASASTIILLILAFLKIEFVYILPVIIIISLAMVSNVRFPKPGYKVNGIAAILILLTLIMGKSYQGIAPLLLLTAILVYAIGGPIYTKFLAKRQ